MINEPPVLTLSRDFSRPEPEKLDRLRDVATGYIVDCLGGQGAMVHTIKPMGTTPAKICGVAIPCDCGTADNLAVFGALDLVEDGDVIIVSTGGHEGCAVIGDLVMGMAKNAGAVGIVTDGMVRDIAGINEVGLTCYAAGITPNSPQAHGPGTAGLPVVCGGRSVSAGDIVIGDADGIVILPLADIDRVLDQLADVKVAEAMLEDKVAKGLKMPEKYQALLSSDKVVEV